jgi:hypothetical protein
VQDYFNKYGILSIHPYNIFQTKEQPSAWILQSPFQQDYVTEQLLKASHYLF